MDRVESCHRPLPGMAGSARDRGMLGVSPGRWQRVRPRTRVGGRSCNSVYQVDLVAMSTHGRSGLSRLVMGSVAEEVLRHANVPVLLVRAVGELPSPCKARGLASQQTG